MDLDKTYRNHNLESRRKALIHAAAAEEAMRRCKQRDIKPRAEIEAAFNYHLPYEARAVDPLAAAILAQPRYAHLSRRTPRDNDARFLLDVADRSSLLDPEHHRTYLPALVRLLEYRHAWVRDADAWRRTSYNVARQFASLARHLLAQYAVPPFFDAVWLTDAPAHHRWHVHVGQGQNLRTADGLPIPLTKMMAHHVMAAPADVSVHQAIRFGQALGLGVPQRIARALLGTRIGDAFAGADVEAFWATVLAFLARHPMLDPAQVGPIVDFLHHQKFVPAPAVYDQGRFVQPGPPQPGLSMKGRDPETLCHQVEAWHRQLARTPGGRGGPDLIWPPCGIPGYDRVEGEPPNQRRFAVTELLSSAALRGEGAAMKHCVATYAGSCRAGRTAIYSVTAHDAQGQRRLVTAEVDVRTRRIVQVRGRLNALPTQFDARVINAWATVARLTFGQYAMGRT